MEEPIEVRIGQVWKDNDKRTQSRYLKVVGILRPSYAICQLCSVSGVIARERDLHILISRMRPTSTGYVLVSEDLVREESQ